uniref:Ig-like domain-containing protein n=1 Tax=Myotis lucifugus TaxID=59463 RepID=G1Q3Y9_MYOLU
FQVQGPHEPMVAMLGGEAMLPCSLVPPQSIKYKKISWTRTLPSQVVHLYEDGRDKPEKAMEEYLGRTQLVKNILHKGIVVLIILNVQPSDNGQYHCEIQHGSFYSEAVIELKVAALGSRPQFHMGVTKSRELQLECKSEGWFPQPKVQWMDSEGEEIPADSETHTQDKGDLFHVTTSLLLREASQKNLTCSVWNPVLNQKKEEQFSIAARLQRDIGAFQVQGPHEPMVAMLGGEAELPCSLEPRQSIKYMKISWTRTLPSQVVHLYEDGWDKPEKAMEEYLGRTQLVKNVMHKGIVVLKILSVQPSDSGQYCCVIQHGSFYSEAVIELKVAALGSRPQFHIEVTKSRELRLECKSEGWFPQPKVQWMDSEGEEIPADSETHTQDKGGLSHVTTSLLLREASQKNLTCSVWNPVLNQKKEEQFSIAGQ